MHPAVRFQDSYLESLQADSSAASIACTPEEDRARQEFAKDADINILLKRFGVNLPVRHPEYGVVDFDLDLQGAYRAVQEAREGFARLPAHLRERYPSWELLMAAVANGEAVSLTPPEEPAVVPPDSPAA
jgi:hypothetical protein